MAVIKFKDVKNMSEKERKEKLRELKFELVKKKVQANKAGKIKNKEIKKAIARILTLSK